MYCSHFGLHRPPFNNTPDPTFYYSTPDHEEALATLQYATQQRKGFVLITGEVGAGKTLIGRMFVRQIGTEGSAAVIAHTQLTGNQLLAAICAEYELSTPPQATNLQLADILQEYLLEEFANDRSVVVLLDEAQNLPDESFETLRMLGNLEADDAKLLQVCILGQPELRARFKKRNMKQLDQRLFRRFHLPALTLQQTAGYINHRLAVAGSTNNQLFTPAAIERVFAASRGTPRLINHICDNALLTAYGQDLYAIDQGLIDEVLERDKPLAAGPQDIAEPQPEKSNKSVSPQPLKAQEPASQVATELPFPSGLQSVAIKSHSVAAESHPASACQQNVPIKQHGMLEPQQCAPAPHETEARIEKIYGSNPVVTETIDVNPKDFAGASESDRLADLVSKQTDELRQQIDAIHESAYPVRERIEQINNRQNELQKIVGGATTRWLATKEKFDVYRQEIQQAINNVAARVNSVQNKIDELARTAAPSEDIEEVRKMHLRETERVLAQVNGQREEFQQLLDQAQGNWSQVCDHVERLASKMVAPEKIAEFQSKMEGRIQKTLDHLDSHRDQLTNLIAVVQRQCDQTQRSVESLREQANRANADLVSDMEHRLSDTRKNVDECLRHTARSEELDAFRDEQTTNIGHINKRLAEFEGQIQAFSRRVDQGFTATSGSIEALENRVITAHDLDQFRKDNDQSVAEAVRQFKSQARSLQALTEEIEKQSQSVGQENRTLVEELSKRVSYESKQLCDLRKKLLDHHALTQERITTLANKLVDRVELEEFRQAQADQGQALRAQAEQHEMRLDAQQEQTQEHQTHIQEHNVRLETHDSRLNAQQEQAEQHEARTCDHESRIVVQEERTEDHESRLGVQQNRAAELLGRIEEDRHVIQRLIENISQRCQSAEKQLDVLSSSSNAGEKHLTELRQEFNEQKNTTHERFEDIVAHWNEAQQEIEALRATTADRETVEAVREQHIHDAEQILATVNQQRNDLQSLAEDFEHRLEAMLARFNALPENIATTDQLQVIQEEGTQHHNDISRRLDDQNSEYKQHLDSINQRCEELRKSVETLATTTTPVVTFEAAEQSLTQDMSTLRGEMGAITSKHQHGLRTLVELVQEISGRLVAVEKLASRPPVSVELKPAVSQELAKLTQKAGEESAVLSESLERANAVSAHLHNASSQVQEIMQDWVGNVGAVQKQSEQLRNSAQMATGILHAMQRCHEAINTKLKSKRWQGELARAEELANRLGQVINDGRALHHQLNDSLDNVEHRRDKAIGELAQCRQKLQNQLIKDGQALNHQLKDSQDNVELRCNKSMQKLELSRRTLQNQLNASLEDFEHRRDNVLENLAQCREEADAWSHKRNQAQQMTVRLTKLLADADDAAARFDKTTNRFNHMIAGIASKTSGLVEVIESARQFDEQKRPAQKPVAESAENRQPSRQVKPVEWPTFATRPARAG